MKNTKNAFSTQWRILSKGGFEKNTIYSQEEKEELNEFKKISGCPVLVNTSFNVRGEPIVCSIEDAFNCFMGTNLDILVIEDFILFKNEQDQSLIKDYINKFELD